jgi:hypothetical protein
MTYDFTTAHPGLGDPLSKLVKLPTTGTTDPNMFT